MPKSEQSTEQKTPPMADVDKNPDEGLAHHDSVALPHKSAPADPELLEAIRAEHQMGFLQALRLYPKAVGWSAYVSLGVIMLAFDPQLIGNLYAMPQFQKDFGYPSGEEVSRASCNLINNKSTPYIHQVSRLYSALSEFQLIPHRIVHHQRRVANRPLHGQPHRTGCRRIMGSLPHGRVWPQAHLWRLCHSRRRPRLHPVLCSFAGRPPRGRTARRPRPGHVWESKANPAKLPVVP